MTAGLLVRAMRDPASVDTLDAAQWNALIAAARAERLMSTLAVRLHGRTVRADVEPILADARFEAEREKRQALWEADRCAAALRHLDCPVILMKGTAYAAANLRAGQGRQIGDLDIMVPRERIGEVEAALMAAGWEWVKPDPYDDAYYRQWMHELPPMIHRERDRMIDVHHTTLPLTARITPDAAAMIADRVEVGNGLSILKPEDMACHAVAHMFADGDMAGGLRNLWDIYCLLDEFGTEPGFAGGLAERAKHHGLAGHVERASRLASYLYGGVHGSALDGFDRAILARLMVRDGWGLERRPFLRLAFFIRSHWLRMPPAMLARHLWTKWRKGHRPA